MIYRRYQSLRLTHTGRTSGPSTMSARISSLISFTGFGPTINTHPTTLSCEPCPQDHYCPGFGSGIHKCPVGTSTGGLTHAVNISACMCHQGYLKGAAAATTSVCRICSGTTFFLASAVYVVVLYSCVLRICSGNLSFKLLQIPFLDSRSLLYPVTPLLMSHLHTAADESCPHRC